MIEPTEDMKGVYYTPSQKNLSAEEMIDDFIFVLQNGHWKQSKMV